MPITHSLKTGPLVLVLFIACLNPSFSSAQKSRVKPVTRLELVDSKGRTMGTLLGNAGLNFAPDFRNVAFVPTVLLDVDGTLVSLSVAKEGYWNNEPLFYESANCVGAPWIHIPLVPDTPLHGLLPSVGIGRPGHTVYVPAAGATDQVRVMASEWIQDRCVSWGLPSLVVPTQSLIDLDTEFTPPFQLKSAQ